MPTQHRKYKPQFPVLFFLSILFGLGWFVLLYGYHSLNPSEVNWIYAFGEDLFKGHIGWEWFRQEPWGFPLGRIEANGYPYGTYLFYMDSVPLLAIPLKVLSPWLGEPFQFQGIWGLLCVIGQMLAGMLILREFTHSYPQMILGASLLVLSPPMMFRMFMHNSLSAHWILLFAIWFIVLEYRHKLWRGAWILLFAASLLVHPYLVAMLVPLWAISLYFQSMHEKKIWPKVVVDILAVSGVLLLVGYSIGIFSLKINHLAQSSYGFYSWNMNGFLNPLYTSAFLKEMLTGTSGQYEGYSYLGLGNLLILIAAFYLLVQKDVPRRQLSFILPFLIAASLFVLFSLTNQGLLGNRLLWDFKLPQFISDLFGMFQGSGRFIWPVFYFLVLFGLIYIIRNDRLPTLILALGLIIQLADMQPLIEIKRIEGTAEYQTPMQSEFWSQAAQSNRHLFLLPAWDDVISIYQPIALYAQQNQLTINWSFFARGDYVSIATLGRQVWQELQAGQSDPQTMYIFWHPEWVENAQENLAGNMLLCTVDGYTIALSVENPITRTNFDLNPYCTFP